MDINLLAPVMASTEDKQRRDRILQERKKKKMPIKQDGTRSGSQPTVYKTPLLSNEMIQCLNEFNGSEATSDGNEPQQTEEFNSMKMLRYLASLKTYQPKNN